MKRLLSLLLCVLPMLVGATTLSARGAERDSAIVRYRKAMEASQDVRDAFVYGDMVIELLLQEERYAEALEVARCWRQSIKRLDIPYYNFLMGELHLQLHHLDSARHYFDIAAQSANEFIASEARTRLSELSEAEGDVEQTFNLYHTANKNLFNLSSSLKNVENTRAFEALKLRNEVNELKVTRQRQVIIILTLGLSLVVLTGGFVMYIVHRRRLTERQRFLQENTLLKQQEEFAALREQEALSREREACMREELFKRMAVFTKLPLPDREQADAASNHLRIQLTDADWADLRLMLDNTYPNFSQRLAKDFPDLTERDLRLCCLVKINVSLQSLADIYCISKNSVSRRKLRLKEKMGIADGQTLDEFLTVF